jgi:hypothetical protein
MDREPIPTFADKWDRLTYLLHSYRVLVSLGALAGVAALLYFRPTFEMDPKHVAAIGSWALLGIGCFPVGFYGARWLRRYRAVTVFHINSVDDVIQKWHVPPAIWDAKTVKGEGNPWDVNDGDAYAVREFEWMEATDTLIVEGCWLSESAADNVLMTDKSHMEDIHDFLLDAYRVLGQVRGRISRMGMDVEKRTINAVHEAQEKGATLERDGIKEVWEDAADDLDEAMPSDPPEGHDIELDGFRPEPDESERAHDQVTDSADIQTNERQ